MDDTAYEAGFRKIAEISELVVGEPKIFRTGGAVILLMLKGTEVLATDATRCVPDTVTSPRERLLAIAECFTPGQVTIDWNEVIKKQPLPVQVNGNEIWICIDLCTST
ncbi:MAG TPA: hypothetical protein VNM92_15755 [Thermoanaerobaculia bacterium]|nr:hypothetical protein [Thermoanaerobaculia bacterium]